MVTLHSIQSFEHPALAPYRTMKEQRDQHQQRIFIAEGEKLVRRLLATDFTVQSALMPKKWVAYFQPLLEKRPEPVDLFVAEKDILEQLTGFSMYQGVLAVGCIPAPAPLEQVLKTTAHPFLFAAADGLNNAENLGVLARNCAAFGVQALLLGETSCSPWLRRAVRCSMGTIFKLPVVECHSLAWTLRELRTRGVHTVAAHPHTDGRTLAQAMLTGDSVIVFGNEGDGVSPEVLAACDEAVAVPMAPGVDSLNVGNAAAVFLYRSMAAENCGAVERTAETLRHRGGRFCS